MLSPTYATSTPAARRPASFPPSRVSPDPQSKHVSFPPSPFPPLPTTALRGVMTVALEAVRDKTSRSPVARRLSIPAHEVAVRSLLEAQNVVRAFICDHRVTPRGFGRSAGVVRNDGKPMARITYSLRILELDARRVLTGRELGEDGESIGFYAGGAR